MICEECKKEGKKSTITIGNDAITDIYYPAYYDEKGIYHDHDGNAISRFYQCSNGHTWRETKTVGKCPSCNWPNEVDTCVL